MPHGDDVVCRAGGEIGAQPHLLRRSDAATVDVPQSGRSALAVQNDDVPAADVVAVVALVPIARGPGGAAGTVEVIEVRVRVWTRPFRGMGVVVMVAGDRA